MSNSQNVLNSIVGYQEAVQVKESLAQTGSDFTETRGSVRQQINALHPKRLLLRVDGVVSETPSTKTFRLIAEEGQLPPFQAGQYINLYVEIDGTHTARPYAISSSPDQTDYYDVTIKRAEGGFVSPYFLDQVQVGELIQSSGPMGTFYHNPLFHGNDLVFLAGGSGIAPALSMIKNSLNNASSQRFYCIHTSSYEDDVIFKAELSRLAQDHDNFDYLSLVTRPSDQYQGKKGRITKEMLSSLDGNLAEKMYYVCGPDAFNESCKALLTELGVPARRIRIEANGAPRHPEALEGWPVTIDPDQTFTVKVKGKGEFTARAGEPLLNSLERHGYSTENACRSGECSLCRVKLVSGEVYNPGISKIRKSDTQFGWVHACVAYPVSDIEVQI